MEIFFKQKVFNKKFSFKLITTNGNFIINVVSSQMATGVFTKVSKLKIFNFNQVNSGIYECRAVVDKQKTSAKFEITLQTGNYIYSCFFIFCYLSHWLCWSLNNLSGKNFFFKYLTKIISCLFFSSCFNSFVIEV